MIESLDIANLGVIASAHVEIRGGLVVVTGETGAGKTVVLSSLQLLAGGSRGRGARALGRGSSLSRRYFFGD